MNPISIRLLSQQLLSPQFSSPHDVVSHFGAMQAQDYRMVRWAVMMRMRNNGGTQKWQKMFQNFVEKCYLCRI